MTALMRANGLLPSPLNMEDGDIKQKDTIEDIVLMAFYCYQTYYQDEK